MQTQEILTRLLERRQHLTSALYCEFNVRQQPALSSEITFDFPDVACSPWISIFPSVKILWLDYAGLCSWSWVPWEWLLPTRSWRTGVCVLSPVKQARWRTREREPHQCYHQIDLTSSELLTWEQPSCETRVGAAVTLAEVPCFTLGQRQFCWLVPLKPGKFLSLQGEMAACEDLLSCLLWENPDWPSLFYLWGKMWKAWEGNGGWWPRLHSSMWKSGSGVTWSSRISVK